MIDDYLRSLYRDLEKYHKTKDVNENDMEKYLDTMRKIKWHLRYRR